jgi:hypothetical protein
MPGGLCGQWFELVGRSVLEAKLARWFGLVRPSLHSGNSNNGRLRRLQSGGEMELELCSINQSAARAGKSGRWETSVRLEL